MGLEYVSVRWTSQTCNFIAVETGAQISARHDETVHLDERLPSRNACMHHHTRATHASFRHVRTVSVLSINKRLMSWPTPGRRCSSDSDRAARQLGSTYFRDVDRNELMYEFDFEAYKNSRGLIYCYSQVVYGTNFVVLVISLIKKRIWAPWYHSNNWNWVPWVRNKQADMNEWSISTKEENKNTLTQKTKPAACFYTASN